MRELQDHKVTRKDIETLQGVISVEAHLYQIGPISYPYYLKCKEQLELQVRNLNACFILEDQRNLEALSLELLDCALLVLRDKRYNNDYFDSLKKAE